MGDVTVDIENGPAITGPTTMVMGALGKPTQQPFDWGDFLLVALALIIMIEIVVLLLFQLRNRREKQ